jgi:hypothetical protein
MEAAERSRAGLERKSLKVIKTPCSDCAKSLDGLQHIEPLSVLVFFQSPAHRDCPFPAAASARDNRISGTSESLRQANR